MLSVYMKRILGLMGLGVAAIAPLIIQQAYAAVDCAALLTRLIPAVGAAKAAEIVSRIPGCSG